MYRALVPGPTEFELEGLQLHSVFVPQSYIAGRVSD